MADDAVPAARGSRGVRRWLAHGGRLARKELREILRDRRTIVTLVLMPMLVYPLIGVTFQKFLALQLTQRTGVEYRIGARTAQEGVRLQRLLRQADAVAAQRAGRPFDPRRLPTGTEDDPVLRFLYPDDPSAVMDVEVLLYEREIDAGFILGDVEKESMKLELVYDESSALGRGACRYLADRLRLINDEFLEAALRRLDPSLNPPLSVTVRPLPSSAAPGFSLAVLVPLILILMTVTGAVYPAIDLTAGERERGTLEALISAPVRREELLLAKYVAVLAVAILTAIANLTAMTATAYAAGLESLLFGRGGLSFGLIAKVFGVLVVFAGFFSSILLAVTSFARSFKEAQAYLIPVMLASIAPGMLALMPGLTLTWGLSLAPLANMVLLTSDLFDERLAVGPAIAALTATFLYSVVGLGIAARIFGTDAVLYGSSGSWSDVWRRPLQPGLHPTLGQAWGCLAVVLPLFLILGGGMHGWIETSLPQWLVAQVMLTTGLFVLIPAAWAVWQRIPLSAAFQLRRADWRACVGAALAGISLWPFAYEALLFLLPEQRLGDLLERFAELTARLASVPYPARLAVFAVAPAITEELFFRGYFLQGLRREWGRWPAIVAGGAVFGAFHVFVQGLSIERFVPSTFLGVCLGWVCLRTGSVWPGMLLHLLNNAFLLSVSEYSDQLQKWGIGTEQRAHLPAGWLAAAAAATLAAWGILLRSTPAPAPRDADDVRI